MEKTEWIIPCNLRYYDVFGAFANLKTLDWKQSNRNIGVGDIVYIYVGKPVCAIKYRCKVNKVNLPFCEIDDNAYVKIGDVYERYGNYMELELIEEYENDVLSMDKMRALGLKGNIQSPRKLPSYIKALLKDRVVM